MIPLENLQEGRAHIFIRTYSTSCGSHVTSMWEWPRPGGVVVERSPGMREVGGSIPGSYNFTGINLFYQVIDGGSKFCVGYKILKKNKKPAST